MMETCTSGSNQEVTFKSLRDLNRDIQTKLLPQLPRDIGIVYGIPRSGMIPASILATALGARLGMIGGAPAFGDREKLKVLREGAKILLVDDSIHSGKAMQVARSMLSPGATVYTCAVYTRPRTLPLIDFYAEIVDGPRLFQWNFMGIRATATYTWGLDGVICERTGSDEDRSTEGGRDTIVDARPLYLPQVKVKAIVADRPESWRDATEAWLGRYGVQCERLIMRSSTDPARGPLNSSADFKAEHYAPESPLLVEGADSLARAIARLTSRPVLSIESMHLHSV